MEADATEVTAPAPNRLNSGEFCTSRTSATTFSLPGGTPSVDRLSTVCSTSASAASGASRGSESTSTARARAALTLCRSEERTRLPARNTTRVPASSDGLISAASSSSISRLSRSHKMAIHPPPSEALAAAISRTIVTVASVHPRMTVWPRSITGDRPCFSASIFACTPSTTSARKIAK